MTFATFLTWNHFYGSYFTQGVGIQGDLTIDPGYKAVVDTINGNSGNITSDSLISCKGLEINSGTTLQLY